MASGLVGLAQQSLWLWGLKERELLGVLDTLSWEGIRLWGVCMAFYFSPAGELGPGGEG